MTILYDPKNIDQRRVSFAEHDDIYIIREEEEGGDQLGLSSIIEHGTCDERRSGTDFETPKLDDGADHGEEEDSQHQRSLDVRENMRDCVYNWTLSPYWKLLEGCVDDEHGEAKDVQKYITTYACLEVDGDSPRGLERQVCRGHHDARKTLIDNATHAVLSEYFKLRYEENLPDSEIWKNIRHTYKDHSRGARALAKKLGKADEVAANRKETCPEKALALIEELKEKLKSGSLRVKKSNSCSSKRDSENSTRGARSSNSTRGPRSMAPLPMKANSDHSPSSLHHKKFSKAKKDKGKAAPMRFPSFSSKSKKDKRHLEDHAADLFHEIDKKGKTKRSSTWRSLKKKISKTKTVHSSNSDSPIEGAIRTQ